MSVSRLLPSAAMLSIASVAGLAVAQPAIQALQPLPGLEQTEAVAVSDDGRIVVGSSHYPGPESAVRWIDGVPMLVPGCFATVPSSVSGDGSAIVGWCSESTGESSFYWDVASGFQRILPPDVPQFGSSVSAIAGDGSVVVGYVFEVVTARPFTWTPDGGAELLPVLLGAEYSAVYDVNSDGSVMVGSSDRRPVRWTDGGATVQPIEIAPDFSRATAFGVSADGSTVVGNASGGSGSRAFRWTQSTGMVDLGTLPGLAWSFATAVSGDGRAVVGAGSTFPGPETAMVWTEPLGMVDLRLYLMDQGVDVSRWFLERASDITPDGSTITGWGEFDGVRTAFVITGLKLGCSADFDGDGSLTIFDFLAFQNAFDAGDAIADFDGDGSLTILDFLAFQNAFDAGCP